MAKREKRRRRRAWERPPKSLMEVIEKEFRTAWAVLDELMAGLSATARRVIKDAYMKCMTTAPEVLKKDAMTCLHDAAVEAGIGDKFRAIWSRYLADGRTEYGVRWAKYPEVKKELSDKVRPLIAEVYRTCIKAVGAESAAKCYERVAEEKGLKAALEAYWRAEQPEEVLRKAGII